MTVTRPLAAVLLTGTLFLTACGGGSSDAGSDSGGSDTPSTTAAPSDDGGGGSGGTAVKIVDFTFDPADLDVKVGDTITFTNDDSATHTATSEDGAPSEFDTGDIASGDSAEITLDEAGDYEYQCSIHESMKGTIHVME